MKTLLLMRHAKSDWSQGGMGDFDRSLNKRGRRAAPVMANYLRDRNLIPDLALVSDAARTRETWECMVEIFGERSPPHEFLHKLYLARPQALLETINGAPDAASRLLVLGHNPGIELTAALLAAPDQDAPGADALAAIRNKFPTGAIAQIELADGPWAEVQFGSGRIRAFTAPATLPD